ncbi:hypothetical protein N303_04886, partial [Cuculus canorus]
MHMRQLKVERRLSIAAQLAAESKVKAKRETNVKTKGKKSLKAKEAAAWSHSHASPHGAYTCSKPRVAAVNKSAKAQRTQ